jgi:hypothetical protein
MDKKVFIAKAAVLFASYHKANTFYFTSDESPFADEYSAKNHATTLADKTVTPVTRDEAIETVELTDEEAEATLKQLLLDNHKEFSDLFGFDAADGFTWQELDAAIFCHKQFIDRLIEGFETSIHDGLGKLLYKIVAIPHVMPVTADLQAAAAEHGLKANEINVQDMLKAVNSNIFINTDNQPATTIIDLASDAAGTVQEQAPAAKTATEEKPAAGKKAKAPKAKPAVEPAAAEQAEKPAGEPSEQPAAEQPDTEQSAAEGSEQNN